MRHAELGGCSYVDLMECYYKLQNDTKNIVIAHSYRNLLSTNCLLVHTG